MTTTTSKKLEFSYVKANCDKCGLAFQKAELLVKHFLTVHQETSFTAKISIKGLPDYVIVVNKNNVKFECCRILFDNRSVFYF